MLIEYTGQAAEFLQNAPNALDNYIRSAIRDLAPCAGQQMVVVGLTCDGCTEHIYRAFKLYGFKPGLRCIFHRNMTDGSVTVEIINWRDCDPYGDGK